LIVYWADPEGRHVHEAVASKQTIPVLLVFKTGECLMFKAMTQLGQVKPTGVMSYIQRLCIAERCQPGAQLADVRCGRLQLSALYRYAPVAQRISPQRCTLAATACAGAPFA